MNTNGDVCTGTKRVVYLDLLRVIAVFGVMLLHVCASSIEKSNVETTNWQVLNVYDSLVRCCVPILIMISGVFFLNPEREYTLGKLLKKNVSRMLTAYVFWSFCYAVAISFYEHRAISSAFFGSVIKNTIEGRYHLWFINMIVGMYLIVPFLRKIAADRKLLEYFILLSFIFGFAINFFKMLPVVGEYIDVVITKGEFHFVLGYVGYFVAGYYFHTYEISQKREKCIYLLGSISVVVTVVGTSYLSMQAGNFIGTLYNYLLPTICFQAWAVFLFFKKHISGLRIKQKNMKRICMLSKLSFGMYLVHDFVNIVYSFLGVSATSFMSVLAAPMLACGVFFVSFCVIYVMDKIPWVNKRFI